MTHRNYGLHTYRNTQPSWRQRRADAVGTLLLGAVVTFLVVALLAALGMLAP